MLKVKFNFSNLINLKEKEKKVVPVVGNYGRFLQKMEQL